MNKETIKAAREALDSLDDYARMEGGVDAIGPRGVLEAFITLAERATEAGTPAKAGILEPAFPAAKRPRVIDVDAYTAEQLAARAEEARREAYEQGRYDERMAQGPSREEWALIDAEKDGQRTAGGDAVAAAISHWEGPRDQDGTPREGGFGNIGKWSEYQPTTLKHGKAIAERGDKDKRVKWLYYREPVAEAAAQADGEPDHGETVLRVQEALGITRTGWVSPDVVLLRIEQLQRAAPTAQPTPPMLMRDDVSTATALVNEWDEAPQDTDDWGNRASVHLQRMSQALIKAWAQPTPPDGERAAFEAWWTGPVEGYGVMWEAWQARAALRHPPVPNPRAAAFFDNLPNEMRITPDEPAAQPTQAGAEPVAAATITRYEMITEYNKYACADQVIAQPADDGLWVKHDEHEAAIAAAREEGCAAYEAAVTLAGETIDARNAEIDDLRARLASAGAGEVLHTGYAVYYNNRGLQTYGNGWMRPFKLYGTLEEAQEVGSRTAYPECYEPRVVEVREAAARQDSAAADKGGK